MSVPEAKIKAIAPWFGGKRNLAQTIVGELGTHRVYWEPFAGSLAVLLVKPPCVMETVNDLHRDVTNLARVIAHPKLGPNLYRRLRRTLMSEGAFEESATVIREDYCGDGVDLDRAYHYFVVAWLGRNGMAGTRSYNHHFCVRYTANGGHGAKRWQSAVGSLRAWRRRLSNVTILTRDAFDLLPRIQDRVGTAIYVDPPYLKKGATYLHDFGQTTKRSIDKEAARSAHQRLADELNRFERARVVVSYYDHPELVGLYPGWTMRLIEVSKALAHQGRRGENKAKAREVLIINGPSYAAPQHSLF